MTITTRKIRTYSELIQLSSFEDRFRYLKLNCKVGAETFAFDRWLNQTFYKSKEWRDEIRPKIIVRDNGCDLGIKGYDITGSIIVHHMNPIVVDDIINSTDYLLNPEYLICVSVNTHNALHYGDERYLYIQPIYPCVIEREPYDTSPWRRSYKK